MVIDRNNVLKVLSQVDAHGVRADQLATLMAGDAKSKHRLRKLLSDLIEEGAVEKAHGNRYRLVGAAPSAPAPATSGGAPGEVAARPGQVVGKLRVHPAGYGFVVREDGEVDVFVPARYRSMRSTAIGSRSAPGPATRGPKGAWRRCWRAGAPRSPAFCAVAAAACTSIPTTRASRPPPGWSRWKGGAAADTRARRW